jgi:DNA-binding CsgD family transcriptional regulator
MPIPTPPPSVAPAAAPTLRRASRSCREVFARIDRLAESTRLSPRQHTVLRFIALGYRYPEIAAELGIALRTVKMHAESLRKKLDAPSRFAMVRRVYRS